MNKNSALSEIDNSCLDPFGHLECDTAVVLQKRPEDRAASHGLHHADAQQTPTNDQPPSALNSNRARLLQRGVDFYLTRAAFLNDPNSIISMIMAVISFNGKCKEQVIHHVRRVISVYTDIIAMALRVFEGDDPSRHHWYIDYNGFYRLHPKSKTVLHCEERRDRMGLAFEIDDKAAS